LWVGKLGVSEPVARQTLLVSIKAKKFKNSLFTIHFEQGIYTFQQELLSENIVEKGKITRQKKKLEELIPR